MSPLTSAIATDGVPSKPGNGVTIGDHLVAVAVVYLHRRRLPFEPGTATAYVDTSGMTLIVAINPLSSWLSRWQWIT